MTTRKDLLPPLAKSTEHEKILAAIKGRTKGFFMYKGIPYDITELYEDEGKCFVAGVSDDGEQATQEVTLPKEGDIYRDLLKYPREKQMLGQPERYSQGTDRSANTI